MECTNPQISEKLLLFLEGEMEGDESSVTASHIQECAACRGELETLSTITGTVQKAALKVKGACPPADDIIGAVDSSPSLPPQRLKELQDHILSCASCRGEAFILEEMRSAPEERLMEDAALAMPAQLIHAYRGEFVKPAPTQGLGLLERLSQLFTLRRPFAYGAVVTVLLVCLAFLMLPRILMQQAERPAIPSPVELASSPASASAPEVEVALRSPAALPVVDLTAEAPKARELAIDKASPTPVDDETAEKKSTPEPVAPEPAAPKREEQPEKAKADVKAFAAVPPTPIAESRTAMKAPAPRPSSVEERISEPARTLPARSSAAPAVAPVTGAAAGLSTGSAATVEKGGAPVEKSGAAWEKDGNLPGAGGRPEDNADAVAPSKLSYGMGAAGGAGKNSSPAAAAAPEGHNRIAHKELPADEPEVGEFKKSTAQDWAAENRHISEEPAGGIGQGAAPRPIMANAPAGQFPQRAAAPAGNSQGETQVATAGRESSVQQAPPAPPPMTMKSPAPQQAAPSASQLQRRAWGIASSIAGAGKVKSVSVVSGSSISVVVNVFGDLTPGQASAIRRSIRSSLGAYGRVNVTVNTGF